MLQNRSQFSSPALFLELPVEPFQALAGGAFGPAVKDAVRFIIHRRDGVADPVQRVIGAGDLAQQVGFTRVVNLVGVDVAGVGHYGKLVVLDLGRVGVGVVDAVVLFLEKQAAAFLIEGLDGVLFGVRKGFRHCRLAPGVWFSGLVVLG